MCLTNIWKIYIYLHDDFKFLESILLDDYTREKYDNLLKYDFYKYFLRIAKNLNLNMISSDVIKMFIEHLENINNSIIENFYKYEIEKLEEYYDDYLVDFVDYDYWNQVPNEIFMEYVNVLFITKILGVLIKSSYLQNLYTFNDKRIKNETIDQSLRDDINTNREVLRTEIKSMYNDISDELLQIILDTKLLDDEYKINEFIEIEKHDETFEINWYPLNDIYDRLSVFEKSIISTVQCDDIDNNIDNDMKFIESLVSSGNFSELLYFITAEKLSDTDYKIAGSKVFKVLNIDKWKSNEHVIHKLVIHAPKIIIRNKSGTPQIVIAINGKNYVYVLQDRYVYVLKSIE